MSNDKAYKMIKVEISDALKFDLEEGCTSYLHGCQVLKDARGNYFLKVPFSEEHGNARAYEGDWLIIFGNGSYSVYNVYTSPVNSEYTLTQVFNPIIDTPYKD